MTGITPIYMGSTSFAFPLLEFPGDHPHIHGEHLVGRAMMTQSTGSPPYTWGALFHHCHYVWWQRITPIYMGSTHLMTGSSHWNGDHPHIHGEHDNGYPSSLDTWGSPPYTWGAPVRFHNADRYQRITPIYMGSTRGKRGRQQRGKDHPHIHGEHTAAASFMV